MARTETKARKGPESDAHYQKKSTEAGRLKIRENKKRKYGDCENDDSKKSTSSQNQPSKKTKITKARSLTTTSTSQPSSSVSNIASATDVTNASPPIGALETIHEVTSMSILSSAHIQQKVIRVLEILATFPHVPPAKPSVVMLHSKAPVASKMITIAEISKREIAKKGGKWFQYNRVESVLEEKKESPNKARGKNAKVATGEVREKETETEKKSVEVDKEADSESEEEAEAFETMKTPFERAIEGRPKLRALPVMTLYLSRIRIDSLRRTYG